MPRLMIVDMGAVWGGQEIYSRSIAEAMIQKGWSVTCVSPHIAHSALGVSAARCSIRYRDFATTARQVYLLARSHDVVHFNGIRAIYLSAFLRLAAPTVGTKHLPYSNPGESPLRVAVARGLAPWAFRGLDWLIAISRFSLDELPHKVRKRAGVVLNGVADLGGGQVELLDGIRPLRVCFVGRLVQHKGLMRLLESVRLLRDRKVNIELIVAGSGPLADEAHAFVCAHELVGQVRFLGYVSSPREIYETSHVCALPSLHEGLPLSLLEAMSARCALLGHDIPGVRDVIQHEGNGLIAEATSESIADQLQRLDTERSLLARLRSRARVDYERQWRLDRMVDETEAVYRCVMAEYSAKGN